MSDPTRWQRKALEHRFEAVPVEAPGLLTALPETPEPDAPDLLVKRVQREGVVRQRIVAVVTAQDAGDEMSRVALYEAAQALMTRSGRWSSPKAWGMQVARRRGKKKAPVAVARRLAVILHRMWVGGTELRWGRQASAV